jgi:group I intron endonuclease
MIGIYKITNPKGKIYIGQSINIEKRFNQYKCSKAKNQPILHRSFLKYGIENHKFETVCYCNKSDLYELEDYYQILFSANGKNGLNCFVNSDKEYDFLKYKIRRDKYIKEDKINLFCIENIENFKKTNNLINSILF